MNTKFDAPKLLAELQHGARGAAAGLRWITCRTQALLVRVKRAGCLMSFSSGDMIKGMALQGHADYGGVQEGRMRR